MPSQDAYFRTVKEVFVFVVDLEDLAATYSPTP